MDRLLGFILIAFGVYLIVARRFEAERNLRYYNRTFAILRIKRRYGQRQYRHSIRAAWIVGIFAILLGVFSLIADW
jgi:hypothetical protein